MKVARPGLFLGNWHRHHANCSKCGNCTCAPRGVALRHAARRCMYQFHGPRVGGVGWLRGLIPALVDGGCYFDRNHNRHCRSARPTAAGFARLRRLTQPALARNHPATASVIVFAHTAHVRMRGSRGVSGIIVGPPVCKLTRVLARRAARGQPGRWARVCVNVWLRVKIRSLQLAGRMRRQRCTCPVAVVMTKCAHL